MAAKHIWGFGGVRLETGNYTATFTNAVGKLAFEPKIVANETLNGDIVQFFLGYRVKIEFTAYNVCDDDYTEHLNLVSVMNDAMYYGNDLTIYPHYSTTDSNVSYTCRCTSAIDWSSVAAVQAGQSITLTFESTGLVNTLPAIVSDLVEYDWQIYYSGDLTLYDLHWSDDDGATSGQLTFKAVT